MTDLIERRNQLAADMRRLHETAETENRSFTPEERESWDCMTTDLDGIDYRINLSKQVPSLEPIKPVVKRVPDQQIANPAVPTEERSAETMVSEAFNGYMRRGLGGMDHEQRDLWQKRAQAVGTGAAGGYTVPEDFGGRVIETMKQYGGLTNVCTHINTGSGNPLPFPTNDDTGNVGVILAENTQVAEEDAVFGQKVLGAFKYSSKMVRVSVELLQDEEVNLEDYLVNILGKRLGRATSAHYCVGAGTTEPEGIVTGATLEATAAGIAAITYQDMLDLEHTVDPAYRMNGVGSFIFNDVSLKALKGLVDSEGRPLWLPEITNAAPATILGQSYVVDQGMPDIGTGNSSVAFGDLSAYYIRDVLGVQMLRLSERYADYHQVAFLGFLRTDGALMDAGAVAKLTH